MGIPWAGARAMARVGTGFAQVPLPFNAGLLSARDSRERSNCSARRFELMAKIKPLGDKVLIKRLEAEEKTAGGIVLPDTAKEKPKQGKVVAVGDGRQLESGKKAPFQVSVGDVVLFGSFAGTEVTVEGEEYLLMSEEDILAILS
jgi:chaperonin GroES